jgi:hypothetical protein
MTKTDYDYYEWLVSQIETPGDRSYRGLFERMHNFEFVWTVPHDDNRVQDARDLRLEFLDGRASKLRLESATLLEILVSLSRRVAFTCGGDDQKWAWKLLKNLRLNKMSDPLTDAQAKKIDDILYALVWRTYDRSGQGGFFPLKNSLDDQTKVEIWYQLNAYALERSKDF